jgi:hypothetical protein
VDESKGKKTADVAIKLAKEITANSLNPVIATRDGLIAGEDGVGSVEAGRAFQEKWLPIVNMEELLGGD